MNKQRSEILRNAGETGDIWLLTYNGGPRWIRAGKADLGDEKDRGDQALYVDELRAMEREGLVEYRGGDYYQLTGAGFTAAKKALGKINPQETSTAELVESIKQQAESFQKPNEDNAVWKELMVRYRWIGCPKEDSALIASLDQLLRPLNNGWTMLPPGIIPVPGASIPPPPPYYRGKVSLSQLMKNPTVEIAMPAPSKNAIVIPARESSAEISSKEKLTEVESAPATPTEALMRPIWKSPFKWIIILAMALASLMVIVFGILPDAAKVKILEFFGFQNLH